MLGIHAWEVAAAANMVIAGCYFAISWLIFKGLAHTRQLRSNRLGVSTALIFLTCAVHHGSHTVHMLLPLVSTDRAGLAMRAAFGWQMDVWDIFGAAVALVYLSLRSSYSRLLITPAMFSDLSQERLQEAVAAERAALEEAQAVAHVGSWRIDLADGRVARSAELLRILGVDESEAVGTSNWETVHPEDRERVRMAIAATERFGVPADEIYRLTRPDGVEAIVHARARAERDSTGSTAAIAGTLQDVTETERVRRELDQAHARLEAVLEHSPTAIYMRDAGERFVLANQRTAAILGVAKAELIGRRLHEVLPLDLAREIEANDRIVMEGGAPVRFEERLPDAQDDNRLHTYLSVKYPVRNRAGETIGLGGVRLDVTDRARAEQALRVAEERFRGAFEHAPIGVCVLSLGREDPGRVIQANRCFAEMLGRTPEDLLGMPLSAVTHADDAAELEREMRALSEGAADRVQSEQRLMHRDGHFVWALLSSAVLDPDERAPTTAITHVLDISDRKRFEGQLQHLADHDALTGLFNRRRFSEELERALAGAKRYGESGALLILDLDGFKFVNDSLGHAVGDGLINRVATLLQSALRETDVLARLGGDEFAVLLPRVDEAAAIDVADKLLAAIRQKAIAITDQRHARISTSIGIALFSPERDCSADELMIDGDIAMYEAKEEGKDRHVVNHHVEQSRRRVSVRENWNQQLRQAIDEHRFVLHAQVIQPICGNGIPRYELLLRLPDKHGDLIPPGTFLHNAERFGLIERIDRWVLTQAVLLLERSHNAGRPLALAVNMSGRTMGDPTIGDFVARLLSEHAIPPGGLIVEVTETAAIVQIERAQKLAHTLRSLGCRLALDDFGAGFASFYYLKHLDFDYLKIDGEFIRGLPNTPTDQLVVQAVVDIARGMGTQTIAEFVGSDETLELLRGFGVDYGQGYHLGRPGPIPHIIPQLTPSSALTPGRQLCAEHHAPDET